MLSPTNRQTKCTFVKLRITQKLLNKKIIVKIGSPKMKIMKERTHKNQSKWKPIFLSNLVTAK